MFCRKVLYGALRCILQRQISFFAVFAKAGGLLMFLRRYAYMKNRIKHVFVKVPFLDEEIVAKNDQCHSENFSPKNLLNGESRQMERFPLLFDTQSKSGFPALLRMTK